MTTTASAKTYTTREYRVIALREVSITEPTVDTPDQVADYYRKVIAPTINTDIENFVVLLLNTRRRVTGYHHVSVGTLDTILVHPREVFRVAVLESAAAIIVLHNHPSGDATPSDADVRCTRDLIKAGQLLKIDLLDHVVIGVPGCGIATKGHTSLRELGYFH